MKDTYALMGMTIRVEVVDEMVGKKALDDVREYFVHIDEKFSTYKETSEISAINRGELKRECWSNEMQEVFALAEETKIVTKGYFNIRRPDGSHDPSGLVKGWAVRNASRILERAGAKNFFVDVGGDVEARGHNSAGMSWSIGIRNPFKQDEIVKVVYLSGRGIATSGTYIRGQHIYNPHKEGPLEEVVSLSVIGPDVYEADRYATAAFAMEREGIYFIESTPGLEGYIIDSSQHATETTGFGSYTIKT